MVAFREIDRVLDASARFKRPVYLELPRNMVKSCPSFGHKIQNVVPQSDAQALAEAVDETCERLNSCSAARDSSGRGNAPFRAAG